MMNGTGTSRWLPALALPALLAMVAVAYWPGLQGTFLFDDFINLDALGRYGGVRDFDTFLYYLTSSTADPTGRPVAQLSFLMDATDWPADPYPFKRTNLLIHLLNGGLLFLLLARLQEWLPAATTGRTRQPTALLATALWVAHPLWVSTTLYVVQRQAMLACMFALLGLLAWDRCYRRLREGETVRAWAWLSLGVGGATLLAGLSKANGFLLPLLALVVWMVLQAPGEASLDSRRRRTVRAQAALGLGVPSALLLGFLAWQVPAAMRRAAAVRDWTLGERLLSQPRALLDYLGALVAPREGSGGIFTDSFQASRGLADPWTTLPASVALLALVVLAIAYRRKWPRLSVAVLFFLAGHLLESGPVPLELYFEHRNYLPAVLIFWPLAHALLAAGPHRRARLSLAVAIPILWLGLTWQRAEVWGNPPLQALAWAERNPDSPRAQGHAAYWLRRTGHVAEARALLARSEATMPGEAMVALNRVADGCAGGQLEEASIAAAELAIHNQRSWNQATVDWFERMQRAVIEGRCRPLGEHGWNRLRTALAANPTFARSPVRRQVLARMDGRHALAKGNAEAALRAYNDGLALEPRPELALAQAADLGNAGYPERGLRHLDYYRNLAVDPAPPRIRDMRSLHLWLLARTGYYRNELDTLRAALEQGSN